MSFSKESAHARTRAAALARARPFDVFDVHMGATWSRPPERVLPPARTAPDERLVASVAAVSNTPANTEHALLVAAAAPSQQQQSVVSAPDAVSGPSAKAFVRAIKTGDAALACGLLDAASAEKGEPLIERRGMWENTPLILACHYGHAAVALALLERGADPTAVNEQGCTALLYACVEPHMEEVVGRLLGKLTASAMLSPPAAPVYSRHTDETAMRTPLLAAAENGALGTLCRLLGAGAAVEPAALLLAAARGNAEVCSALLSKLGTGAAALSARRAALADAAGRGHESAVEVLCADPELVLATTAPALPGAAAHAEDGEAEGVGSRSSAGAAVRLACELRGVDAPASGEGSGKRERIVRLLTLSGIPLSEPHPTSGDTALHLAACRGLSNVAGVLLAAGADARARNGRGETPADVALAAAHMALAMMLQEAAAHE